MGLQQSHSLPWKYFFIDWTHNKETADVIHSIVIIIIVITANISCLPSDNRSHKHTHHTRTITLDDTTQNT